MNINLATFFGVPLNLNVNTIFFCLILAVFGGPSAALVLITSLFFVVLHEYGHVLAAKYYNWEVISVTILPIGGVASMNFKHDDPKEELVVAAAGPMVNLIIILLCYIISLFGFDLEYFMLINFILAGFNLLPIYPLDGGRILRALLAMKEGHEFATLVAVRSGQWAGGILAFLAFVFGLYLASFVLVFMCFVSQAELKRVMLEGSIKRIKQKAAIILDKPELSNCSNDELILVLESIKSQELKEALYAEELAFLLKDLRENAA